MRRHALFGMIWCISVTQRLGVNSHSCIRVMRVLRYRRFHSPIKVYNRQINTPTFNIRNVIPQDRFRSVLVDHSNTLQNDLAHMVPSRLLHNFCEGHIFCFACATEHQFTSLSRHPFLTIAPQLNHRVSHVNFCFILFNFHRV
jgi:hypothetical protein